MNFFYLLTLTFHLPPSLLSVLYLLYLCLSVSLSFSLSSSLSLYLSIYPSLSVSRSKHSLLWHISGQRYARIRFETGFKSASWYSLLFPLPFTTRLGEYFFCRCLSRVNSVYHCSNVRFFNELGGGRSFSLLSLAFYFERWLISSHWRNTPCIRDSLRDSSRATSVSGHGTHVTCLLVLLLRRALRRSTQCSSLSFALSPKRSRFNFHRSSAVVPENNRQELVWSVLFVKRWIWESRWNFIREFIDR